MIINKLISTGIVTLATGQTYTLKDDEVFINEQLWKKQDVEIDIANNYETQDPTKVVIGITSRGERKEQPAYHCRCCQWLIDGQQKATLSECIDSISNAIYYSGSSSGSGNVDLSNYYTKLETDNLLQPKVDKNIYTDDGTLTGNRIVDLATKIISFINGKIGFGTTNPTERVHIDGNIKVTGAYVDSFGHKGVEGQFLSAFDDNGVKKTKWKYNEVVKSDITVWNPNSFEKVLNASKVIIVDTQRGLTTSDYRKELYVTTSMRIIIPGGMPDDFSCIITAGENATVTLGSPAGDEPFPPSLYTGFFWTYTINPGETVIIQRLYGDQVGSHSGKYYIRK